MSPLWIDGAVVADGTGTDPVAAGLLVDDGVITQVGGTRPAGAETYDAAGLFITPGLIDAHVHIGLSSPINAHMRHDLSVAEIAADMFGTLASTLDQGFTTVRDCGGIDGGVVGALASGKLPGPRVLASGPIQCQRGGHGQMSAPWEATELWHNHDIPGLASIAFLSDSPDTMRANVRESFRRGASFIKLCATGGVVSFHDKLSDTQLTVEEMRAAVYEAKARGTYVTIHAHNNAGIRNGVAAGVECVEHGSDIDEETAALMAAKGVAHVPTFAVVEALLADPTATGLSGDTGDRIGAAKQGQIDGLLASTAAGVLVGSGSDLIGPNQHGRGRELSIRAGIQSPMEALVAATANNARVLRIADQVGTLEVGKQADLVAWSADPLADAEVFSDRSAIALIMQRGAVIRDTR